jgi:hypothetical protein
VAIHAALLSSLAHCNDEPRRRYKELKVHEKCETPEVLTCLQDYAFEELTQDDVERIIMQAVQACLSDDSSILARQATCLGVSMGTDVRVGLALYVSAGLRRYKHFVIVGYGRSSLQECCARGAIPASLSYSRNYEVCRPPEYLERMGDSEKERARKWCGEVGVDISPSLRAGDG